MWLTNSVRIVGANDRGYGLLPSMTSNVKAAGNAVVIANTAWSNEIFLVDQYAAISCLRHDSGTVVLLTTSIDTTLDSTNAIVDIAGGSLSAAFRPAQAGSFDLSAGNPYTTENWCADNGFYKFAPIMVSNTLIAGHMLDIISDDNSSTLFIISKGRRYASEGVIACIDGREDAIGSLATPGDTYLSAQVALCGSTPYSSSLESAHVQWLSAAGSLTAGAFEYEECQALWETVEDLEKVDLTLPGKGVLDSSLMCTTNVGAPIDAVFSGMRHVFGGMCIVSEM